MRFERLDIDRYGCFTGQTLDFGAALENGDLHLVYGPNEAGKSTLRDACIDFLFGFPHQTRYDFVTRMTSCRSVRHSVRPARHFEGGGSSSAKTALLVWTASLYRMRSGRRHRRCITHWL